MTIKKLAANLRKTKDANKFHATYYRLITLLPTGENVLPLLAPVPVKK